MTSRCAGCTTTARWYRSHSATRIPANHATVVHVDRDTIVHLKTAAHEQVVRLTSCVDDFLGVPGSDDVHEPTLIDSADGLTNELAARGWGHATVGLERWSSLPNPATLSATESALTARGFCVRDATQAVKEAHRLKSAAEIVLILRAHPRVTGIRELHRSAHPGMTEPAAWTMFIAGIVAAGSEPTTMHETVAIGQPMPLVHGLSSRRVIQPDDYTPTPTAVRHRASIPRPRHANVLDGGEPAPELSRMAEIASGAQDVGHPRRGHRGDHRGGPGHELRGRRVRVGDGGDRRVHCCGHTAAVHSASRDHGG